MCPLHPHIDSYPGIALRTHKQVRRRVDFGPRPITILNQTKQPADDANKRQMAGRVIKYLPRARFPEAKQAPNIPYSIFGDQDTKLEGFSPQSAEQRRIYNAEYIPAMGKVNS